MGNQTSSENLDSLQNRYHDFRRKYPQGNSHPEPLFPIYQCPHGRKVAWIARKPKEIQWLQKAGAVQTSSSPFMSQSSEILSSDGRYPSFKCIESYSAGYVSNEDPYNKNAMNDGTTISDRGVTTAKYTEGFTRQENRLYDRYGVIY